MIGPKILQNKEHIPLRYPTFYHISHKLATRAIMNRLIYSIRINILKSTAHQSKKYTEMEKILYYSLKAYVINAYRVNSLKIFPSRTYKNLRVY